MNCNQTKKKRVYLTPIILKWILHQNISYKFTQIVSFLKEPRVPALPRPTLGKSLKIGTIVVNHVILLHPSESSSPICIESLSFPISSISHSIGRQWRARRWVPRPHTGIGIEVSIVGSERSLGPICFHEPTSRCPLVCVPKARVKLHGLALWKGNPNGFLVFEYSYGDVIH